MDDQGLTIAQAAKALGVSPKTIRRYIKDGKISSVLAPGKYGEEYRIPELPREIIRRGRLDKDETPGSTPSTAYRETTDNAPALDNSDGIASAPTTTMDITPTLALDIIKDLQKTNVQLAAQLGAAQERIRELGSQLRLLTAPKGPWWKRILRMFKASG